jgi:hypothetical protein
MVQQTKRRAKSVFFPVLDRYPKKEMVAFGKTLKWLGTCNSSKRLREVEVIQTCRYSSWRYVFSGISKKEQKRVGGGNIHIHTFTIITATVSVPRYVKKERKKKSKRRHPTNLQGNHKSVKKQKKRKERKEVSDVLFHKGKKSDDACVRVGARREEWNKNLTKKKERKKKQKKNAMKNKMGMVKAAKRRCKKTQRKQQKARTKRGEI